MVVTTISIKSVSFCSFLPNAKELGREISEWWSEKYDNSYGTKIAITLKKMKKRKDHAPLKSTENIQFNQNNDFFVNLNRLKKEKNRKRKKEMEGQVINAEQEINSHWIKCNL